MGQTKVYETAIDLSAFTNTDDAEGEREPVAVETPPSLEQIQAVLESLTGEIQQVPPAYSAIKINGQRAYKLARKGEDVKLKPRTVRVDEMRLVDYNWPHLSVVVTCGKGTYIRSLARQIGEALGTGGYLTALRRTAVGAYTIEQSVTLDDLPRPLLQEHLLPVPDFEKSDKKKKIPRTSLSGREG
jgi:tRNA pseudouridine55 synthase